jgi:hypothetical protein
MPPHAASASSHHTAAAFCPLPWRGVPLQIGEMVGARLISHAGSLTNLAKAPASTVQILGAEKALFRALKTKGNTPKYGLIFHSSFIGRAAAKNKGRISRYLANKCSIAARIDSFSDKVTTKYGERLRDQVEDRLKFYETGEAPKRNSEVMKSVIDELRAEGGDDLLEADGAARSAKKAKKDKKGTAGRGGWRPACHLAAPCLPRRHACLPPHGCHTCGYVLHTCCALHVQRRSPRRMPTRTRRWRRRRRLRPAASASGPRPMRAPRPASMVRTGRWPRLPLRLAYHRPHAMLTRHRDQLCAADALARPRCIRTLACLSCSAIVSPAWSLLAAAEKADKSAKKAKKAKVEA